MINLDIALEKLVFFLGHSFLVFFSAVQKNIISLNRIYLRRIKVSLYLTKYNFKGESLGTKPEYASLLKIINPLLKPTDLTSGKVFDLENFLQTLSH
jgi:hypothetical protein